MRKGAYFFLVQMFFPTKKNGDLPLRVQKNQIWECSFSNKILEEAFVTPVGLTIPAFAPSGYAFRLFRSPFWKSWIRACRQNIVCSFFNIHDILRCRLIIRGYRHPLAMKDLWTLNNEDKASNVFNRFQTFWRTEMNNYW